MSNRFGGFGLSVWQRAHGAAPTALGSRTPPPELACEIGFEPPLESAEAVCFSVRTTAERFVQGLAERQLVAVAVRIEAEADGVVTSARTWLHPRCFTSRDLVDRVHWQLQAGTAGSGLRCRRDSGSVRARDRAGALPARDRRAGRRPRRRAVGRRRRRAGDPGSGAGAGDDRLRRRAVAGAPGRPERRRPAGERPLGRASGRAAAAGPAVAGADPRSGSGAGVRQPACRPTWSTSPGGPSR